MVCLSFQRLSSEILLGLFLTTLTHMQRSHEVINRENRNKVFFLCLYSQKIKKSKTNVPFKKKNSLMICGANQ